MNARFTAKGEKPEWRLIYDALLADADFGVVITYEQLADVLGRDLQANRAPLYRARSELGDLRKRWLEPVPNVGYRVVEPSGMVRISAGHKRKSRRQLGLAVRILESTDVSRLTDDALSEWDSQQKLTFALWAVVAHESRLRKIEAVLKKEGLL